MIQKYRTRTPDGLYARLEETAVLSCSAHQLALLKGLPLLARKVGLDSKIYLQAKEGLELIAKLPTTHIIFLKHTGPTDTVYHRPAADGRAFGSGISGCGPAFVWHKPGRTHSSSSSLHVDHSYPSAKDAGWDLMIKVHQRAAALSQLLALVKCSMATNHWSTGLSSLSKKIPTYTFEAANNTANMDQAESFVVMLADGFAGKNGLPGAIGSARTFESAAAAKSWCATRQFKQWKVLGATISVQRVIDLPGDTPMDAAQSAIAAREARELQAFVERADIEMLRARIVELEAGLAHSMPTGTPQSSKSRL